MTDTNEEFIADPTNHVLAVIDDREQADAAAHDLEAAGFAEVRVYKGRDGAHALDARGEQHSAGEHAVRVVQQVFSNKDNLMDYERATREGAAAVAVRMTDQAKPDEAVAILERHGAHTIQHFGNFVVETVKP